MKLRVKKNKSTLGWHLMTQDSQGVRYVPQSSWPAGFNFTLSYEQALEVQRSYNNSHDIKQEGSRLRILDKKKDAAKIESAFLPPDITTAYELAFLRDLSGKRLTTAVSIWKAVQRLVADLAIDPSDWLLNPKVVYRRLVALNKSLDWCTRVLRAANSYGYLYCKKRGTSFAPVPEMPRYLKQQVIENFTDSTKSGKLTKEQVDDLKDKLSPSHWAWVAISFHWGLRPEEVDILCGPNEGDKGLLWKYEDAVLTMYQPKLRDLPRDRRYKQIPRSNKTQEEVLSLRTIAIRPPIRVVRRTFPEGVTLYGGRHGFTSYWDAQGVDIRTISQWLGHRHLSTTETYYVDIGLIHHKKVG